MDNLTFESTVTLRNGRTMPIIGYSTEIHSESERTQIDIFLDAIETGYRLFDVAYTDRCLPALRKAITKSGIPREEFCIIVKLPGRVWANVAAHANDIIEDFEGYVDVLTASWPYTMGMSETWSGNPDLPKTANGFVQGMQDLDAAVTLGIGVCNFDIKHMEALKDNRNFKFLPLVDENQFHPLYTCEDLREYCRENHIVFIQGSEANEVVKVKKAPYATDVSVNGELYELTERERKANRLGLDMIRNGILPAISDFNLSLAKDMMASRENEVFTEDPYDRSANPREETDFYAKAEPINRISERYGKTNRQIISRWALQHGAVVLVKGIFKEDMEQGKDLFDFTLTKEEIEWLDSFNMNKRFGYNPDYIDF